MPPDLFVFCSFVAFYPTRSCVFLVVSKLVGQAWQAVSDQEKAELDQLYEKARAAYVVACNNYMVSGTCPTWCNDVGCPLLACLVDILSLCLCSCFSLGLLCFVFLFLCTYTSPDQRKQWEATMMAQFGEIPSVRKSTGTATGTGTGTGTTKPTVVFSENSLV